ncbi:hypothetical protein V5799_022343 [Amblyomma americanum]|uniref:Uncharacterized protein n=1 Tax=Amblyomma americanum TaxID=6943 RepID=A0AAQ4FMB2_AMBAM
MPRLPKEEIKIVVRPKDGRDIIKVGAPTVTAAIFAAADITGDESAKYTVCPNSHRNIVVVSTSKRAKADRYAKLRDIHLQGKPHEVNAYETVPDNTTKGVIPRIPIEDGPRALDENIVNPRNPLALAAKRIGTTTTVAIAFDGLKSAQPRQSPPSSTHITAVSFDDSDHKHDIRSKQLADAYCRPTTDRLYALNIPPHQYLPSSYPVWPDVVTLLA